MTPELLEAAVAHARREAPNEACGLLVVAGKHQARYWPCRNLYRGEAFRIDPRDRIQAEAFGSVVGVVHSHPAGPCSPGPADLRAQAAEGLPWWVVTVGGEWMRFGHAPLLRRPFAWGVQDCYTLAADAFGGLPEFLRAPRFWEERDLFAEGLARAGFKEISKEDLQEGDGLLFSIRGEGRANHCGIYRGAGEMLHHLPGRLSIQEPVGAWIQSLVTVVRRIA